MNQQSYYEREQSEIEKYITLWQLSNLELIDDQKNSCVIKCESRNYGKAILKKRSTTKEIKEEYNTLVEYNGKCFCKAYEADVAHGVLLEEQILPGNVLREVASLDKRLSIFCGLQKELHILPSKPEQYRTYLDWVTRITRYMEQRSDYKELTLHMQKAEVICNELFRLYPLKMLLHGDLHHDNILLNSTGGYTIIDPKGILGDPIFDLPRFIVNELENDMNDKLFEKIMYIIHYFSEQLQLPVHRIKECFYVELAMSECWNVEDGDPVNINKVEFAKRILES
ncbi:aminoglycoside phosphotransferase family protein [Anaeromicropila herbilytica]|uniref:Hydroxyurea phosphotransferase n=1 Tax=Anaeromicropila herbilytica TaxID=2785025 RepID=A0A7R7ELI4_9FIRM|nr:aminoglycoside phosphotransferase family protein [Anaeromicropila herbilytica]BCN31091.1 hydroxyurea phosphotransferase [Anaeromicropila herbilytica]